MASHRTSTPGGYPPGMLESDSSILVKVVALMLGILVGVLGFFALVMWTDARQARDDANAAPAPESQAAAQSYATDHNTALPLNSFAGVVPEDAQELADSVVSAASSAPWCMTAIRSASPVTTSMWCSTMSTVLPSAR